jgi:hypothetical protein
MTAPDHFNTPAAGALVLGGLAALLLATVIALNGYGRRGERAASLSAAATASSSPGAGGTPSETEVEYLPDTGEPRR